ncbi:acyltransferase family protein [Corynebacterium sp. HS2168-gen11]|uniref:acyltransferase family protein n=1 Tax=Corynebacterium sp. HS2168-gen11 TaxID=2974027 RepID=UPI00216B2343|nr:acyltransferase family protein [Corynebacterium sp. HS2168-gen11]MCS4536174.1 acyltransferase family protein [Corynebacterium sp. HS2168-gen11]
MNTTPQKTRLAWPDVARGISIIGVVVLHSTSEIPGGNDTFFATINHFISYIRMPLFFMVAGFFAVKVYRFSFQELFFRRLWFLAVPYVIWVPIELCSSALRGHFLHDTRFPSWFYFVSNVISSQNMYWFLYMLIMFTIILWTTRTLAWHLQLLIPAMIVVLTPILIQIPIGFVPRLLYYLPIFLLGAYLRPFITKYATWCLSPLGIAVSLLLAVTAYWFEHLVVPEFLTPIQTTLISMIYMPVGITVAVALSMVAVLGSAIQLVGRHTLVIYLGHAVGLNIGIVAMVITGMIGSELPITLIVFVGMLCAALGSYAVYGLTHTRRFRWAIFPPELPIATASARVSQT